MLVCTGKLQNVSCSHQPETLHVMLLRSLSSCHLELSIEKKFETSITIAIFMFELCVRPKSTEKEKYRPHTVLCIKVAISYSCSWKCMALLVIFY